MTVDLIALPLLMIILCYCWLDCYLYCYQMYCSEDDWFLARVMSNWQNRQKVDIRDPRNIIGMTSLPWKIWEMQTIAGEILIVIDVLLHRPVLRFLVEYLLLHNENIFLVVLNIFHKKSINWDWFGVGIHIHLPAITWIVARLPLSEAGDVILLTLLALEGRRESVPWSVVAKGDWKKQF